VKNPTELKNPTEILSYLKNDTSHYRIYDLSGFVPQNKLPEYNLETVTGYDIFILKDYQSFTNLIGNKSGLYVSNLPIEYMGANEITNTKILDLLNVKYLLTQESANISGYSLAYEKKDFILERDYDPFKQYSNKTLDLYIYKNTKALPRAYLMGTAKTIYNHSLVLNELNSDQYDPKEYIIIEKEPPAGHKNVPLSEEVDIGYYSPNRITLNVTLDKPMFLVLSEVYYPGWKAYDNGNETEIFRTDYILRSIWLDKGIHKIVFSYEPRSFQIGKTVSIITLISLICVFIFLQFFR
jgi:uncharacterized membrane protein YfhO